MAEDNLLVCNDTYRYAYQRIAYQDMALCDNSHMTPKDMDRLQILQFGQLLSKETEQSVWLVYPYQEFEMVPIANTWSNFFFGAGFFTDTAAIIFDVRALLTLTFTLINDTQSLNSDGNP